MARWEKETCPACGGNNFGITKDNGVSFCFNCGHWERDGHVQYKPRVRSEHIDEIRNFYAQASSYYHNALDGEARRFLIRRGFTDDTIERFQVGYCPIGKHPMYRSPIAQEAGLATNTQTGFLANRITFPYFFDNKTITDIRGRSIDPTDNVRYKSPYNDGFYRGADYVYNNHLVCDVDTLVITEGEIKADIATQFGFTTIALPGIMAKRKFIQQQNQRVIILFDSQRKSRREVATAIKRLAEDIRNPYVATLPLFAKDKQDIDSFILEYGTDSFRDVLVGALNYGEWNELQRF